MFTHGEIFSSILKSRAKSRGLVSTNQTNETKICVHKSACAYVTHTHTKEKSPANLQLVRCATSNKKLVWDKISQGMADGGYSRNA